MKAPAGIVLTPWVLLAGLAFQAPASGQTAEAPTGKTLIYTEEYIQKQFKDLTFRMLEVAKLLEEAEPASSRAVREAVDQAQRSLIDQNMSRVIEYLEKGLVAMAGTTQETVVSDLRKVLVALESSVADLDTLTRQIQDWQDVLKKIEELAERQAEHQRSANIAAKGEAMSRRMGVLADQLRRLIKRQEELRGRTRKLPEGDPPVRKLGQIREAIRQLIEDQGKLNERTPKATVGQLLLAGQRQKELEGRADKLSAGLGDLAKDSKLAAALGKAGAPADTAKAAAGHVGSAAGEMGASAGKLDATDADAARPHQEQAVHDLKKAEKALTDAIAKLSAATRAGDLAKHQSALGQETTDLAKAVKEEMAKAGAGSQAGSQSGQQSNLDRAAGHMGKAAEQLDQQERDGAADAQAEALREMEGTSRKLGELARKILEEAKKADLAEQKQQQDVTGERTRQLAEKMAEPAHDGKPTPGQEPVAGAGKSMQRASRQLGEGDASGASQNQGKASQQLRQAGKELRRAIDQARQAVQEQALARIDAMLSRVLEAQKNITKATAATYERRVGKEYERPQILKLAELSDGEGELATKVQDVLKLVKGEGTTAVFPIVLAETRADLGNVQRLLARKQAGALAQSVQKDIEKNLQDMIDALRQEMRRRRHQGSGPGSGGGGGAAPLVPPVAELKMLRTLQKQINARTIGLDAQARSGELAEVESRVQHKILAERQGKLVKMTKALDEKLGRGGPTPAGEGEAH